MGNSCSGATSSLRGAWAGARGSSGPRAGNSGREGDLESGSAPGAAGAQGLQPVPGTRETMERLSAIEPARDRLLEGTRGSARAEKIKGARTVAPEKRASAQRYKKDGKSAFARGDYTLAVDYFSSAIELDPLDPDLLSCRASAYAALAAQSPELRAASAAARKDAAAAAALAARRAEGRGGELARLARSNLERRREAMETAYRDGENMLASTPGELDEMD